MVESGSGGGMILCVSSVKCTWREGSLAGDCEGYIEKALEMGISSHRGPVWGPQGGLICWGLDIWMKGLWGWSISL